MQMLNTNYRKHFQKIILNNGIFIDIHDIKYRCVSDNGLSNGYIIRVFVYDISVDEFESRCGVIFNNTKIEIYVEGDNIIYTNSYEEKTRKRIK